MLIIMVNVIILFERTLNMKIIKVLLILISICGKLMAMDRDEKFLNYITSTCSGNLLTISEKIKNYSGDSSVGDLLKKFEEKFEKCFDGEVVSFVNDYSDFNIIIDAAQKIALAYLKKGREDKNIDFLNKALAFFKSIPYKEQFSFRGTDQCFVDYVAATNDEIVKVNKLNKLNDELKNENFSVFFK